MSEQSSNTISQLTISSVSSNGLIKLGKTQQTTFYAFGCDSYLALNQLNLVKFKLSYFMIKVVLQIMIFTTVNFVQYL